ncbi:protein ARV 2-like isoform X2 [Zingiber officinale]|uniref:protein ARV 2-like isoform X2 n=1 Tax=Zingiber officinale TaxID=94328 RepID=UPI001C4D7ED0|nr:protein ARV 2-like isoform X2 [Zingiber officinale]
MSTVSDKSSEGSEHHRLLCCVNSTREIPSLYIQYSSGNIHLMKCEYCRAIADPYIKCEFMLQTNPSGSSYLHFRLYLIAMLRSGNSRLLFFTLLTYLFYHQMHWLWELCRCLS